nr:MULTISPECIES: hypothetical protein [Rhizobium]
MVLSGRRLCREERVVVSVREGVGRKHAKLCDAAIDLYDDGCRSLEEMATVLIGTYVGLAATRVNAPSSNSVH